MRYGLLITLAAFAALPAFADEREPFYGSWGTAKQCAGELVTEGGTVRAEPFRIDADWLRQGERWCRLNWFPVERRDGGTFSGAHAQCGEDAVRGYSLGMALIGEELTLRWEFPLKNGPLRRCSNP